MLLKKLNLPNNVQSATIEPRLNGEILPQRQMSYMLGTGDYEPYITLVVTPTGNVEIRVLGPHDGFYCLMFCATVTLQGDFVSGNIRNGPRPSDLADLHLFIEVLSKKTWDKVTPTL